MQALEYRTIDKSEWARGEWDDEPDKIQFQDEATGLPCLIVRNRVGGLCGYVGVEGGLTFSGHCQTHSDAETNGVCHIPDKGEADNVWWLGFDCVHLNDLVPSMTKYRHIVPSMNIGEDYDVYRNIEYVKAECAALALQLKAIA